MSCIEVELLESMGSDSSVAHAAWTSSFSKTKREERGEDSAKIATLVPKLIKEGHSTPLESVVFRFWVRMPIFTDRQFMTHRMQSSNGLSGRYRTMPTDFYDLPKDCTQILEKAHLTDCAQAYFSVCDEAYRKYEMYLKELRFQETKGAITNTEYKRAREVLRGMLPTSGMVERVTTMNLRSFANFIRLRLSNHAQPEIREVALKMLEAVEQANIAPIAINTLKETNWVC